MNYRRQSYNRGNELSPAVIEILSDSRELKREPRDYLGAFAKGLIVGGLVAICFGFGADHESVVEYGAYATIAGVALQIYQTAVRKK